MKFIGEFFAKHCALFAWQIYFGKIDPRCQFHQHFLRAFFVQIYCQSQNITRK